MTSAVWVGNCYHEVGLIERKVVISSIPKNYITTIRIIFGSAQNGFIINTGINHISANHMWFVLFHFFNGAIMKFQIFNGSKALNFLLNQVSIGHWMTNGNYLQALLHQQLNYAARGLAFAAAGADSANGNYWFGAFYISISGAE